MIPTGFGAAPVPSLNIAIQRVLNLLYPGIPLPEKPITVKHVAKPHRNAAIRARYAAGKILKELAAEYGILYQRIHQIIHSRQR
jgi:hypothetical protein